MKLEAVAPVGTVRSERVAVKVGGDVISLSSAALLRRPGLSGGGVVFSYGSVEF